VPAPLPSLQRLHQRLLPLALAALLAAPAAADRLITEDGRVIQLVKARQVDDGYHLVFENGEFNVGPDARIASIEMEGDMSDYVPQNDDEREKLADGFVRYKGKWMSKARYETERRKEFEAAKERTDELVAHSAWHNAWEKETKHFLIKSNTSEELLDYYAELLEAYYKLMDKRVGIKPTPSYRRKKMTVNIYKSREEFRDLSAANPGASTLGYFWSYDDTLNFFHDYDDPAMSDWVALHECTHLLTFLIDQQYGAQIWLNEAVADYFGSSDIEVDDRGRITITPGKLQTDRVLTVQEAMRDEKDTKLEELFFISRDGYSGFQYAHGWSFVYFLYNADGGKHAKDFTRFFKDLYTLAKGIPYTSQQGAGPTGTEKRVSPKDIRDLLMDAIGYDDLDELEKDWKAFIATIPVDSGPALLKRGLIRTARGQFKDAIDDLDRAIEQGVQDPRAWATRGQARTLMGQRDAGLEDLRQAIELAPLSARYRYALSTALVGVVSFGNMEVEGKLDFDDEEAKAQAGLAMELDPQNAAYERWFQRFD